MVVRDVSSSSMRVLTATGLIWVLMSCKDKPSPVPSDIDDNFVAVATGGASGTQRTADSQSLPRGGQPVAGAPNTQQASKFAAALGNIGVFKAVINKPAKVPYVGELYDERNQFDPATHRFTAASAHFYQICASLASLAKDFELHLYVNGTRENAIATARQGAAQGCRTVNLKAGGSVEVWVQQTAGASMAFEPNDLWDWMNVNALSGSASLDNINAFTAATSAFTKVPYVAELYDIDNQFDVPSSRFTVAAPGDYQVCASLTAPGKDFELDLFINGNRENSFANSSHGTANGCRTVRLSQGQYVEVMVHQASGASMAFAPNQFRNWLTIDKISATDAPLDISLDNTTDFAVPTNTPTKVPYVNVVYDAQKQFDAQSNRFTTTAPGDYRVCASLASLAQDFELDLFVNGVRDKAIAAGGNGIGQGCRTVRLKKVGDFAEVWVHQISGAPIKFATNQFWNWMTIEALNQFQ